MGLAVSIGAEDLVRSWASPRTGCASSSSAVIRNSPSKVRDVVWTLCRSSERTSLVLSVDRDKVQIHGARPWTAHCRVMAELEDQQPARGEAMSAP